ncbi:MAG: M42 family peptidase [Sphaerobacteraceae bacterium]|nr:MAG: M42 family peptidase [Sphaerobacteraceae bacterium]
MNANELNLDLVRKLLDAPGIAGREDQVRAIVKQEMEPLVDEITVDAMGSVIGVKKGSGNGPKVMLAAHMDEIGFMVRFIDENGFLRLQNVGGFDPRVLPAQRVNVHTRSGEVLIGALQLASKPIHLLGAGEIKAPKLTQIYVDLGLTADEVNEKVDIGDMVTMDRSMVPVGNNLMSRAMDDRINVFVMLETLRALGSHDCDIIAVATTQEEIGLRGAQTSAYGVDPDIGVALDVTVAGDSPGVDKQDRVTKLGEGVAIKVFDSSHIPNYKLVNHFRDIATEREIPHQVEMLSRGGTDAGAMQRSRAGMPVITLSMPTRYLHTVNEMVSKDDIAAAITLLTAYLETAHTGDYRLD